MRRQAVHEQRIRVGRLHNPVVNLIVCKALQTLLLFLFLAHARPNIGHHQVRVLRGVDSRFMQTDSISTTLYQIGIGMMSWRGGDSQVEAIADRRIDIRMTHVVAVSDPGNRCAGNIAAELEPGLHIRQQLTGVQQIAESVDHRHAGMLRQCLQAIVAEGADQYSIHHAGNYFGAVFNGLAAPEVAVTR